MIKQLKLAQMMYNDVDSDLTPFNDAIDGEEIFLFSNTKATSTGASFLQEDDDEHLRHQHNVGAGTSSHHHMSVDVDELLLNTNFLEQTNCDQTEDPLFWSCKDISDDQLNEFLPQGQLNLSGNTNHNINNTNNCVNSNATLITATNTANNCNNTNNTQLNSINITQQPPALSQIQHSQTIIPIQQHQLHQQHQTTAPLISHTSQPIQHEQQLQQTIRLQQPQHDTINHQQQATVNIHNQHHQQILQTTGFQPQQVIQHIDQYQSKWITLVQTSEPYQTYGVPTQTQQVPPTHQQHVTQQFFDKIPQVSIIQADINTPTIRNQPVSHVVTTSHQQVVLQPTQPQSQVQQQLPLQRQPQPQQQQPTQQQQQQQPQQMQPNHQNAQHQTSITQHIVLPQIPKNPASTQTPLQQSGPTNVKTEQPEQQTADTTKKDISSTKHNKPKEKQTRLDCPYCKRSFSKNFDLQQHMRCHTGEKPFQCIVCGRGFAQKSNVKKHMQAHKVWPEGPNNPQIPSNHNGTRSRNNSASSSVGTPRDDECMQENESNLQVNDNNNNVNPNNNNTGLGNDKKNDGNDIFAENRYSCSYCQFNGRTYFELKSHLTIHKREKVFKCIVNACGKTFSGSDLQGFLDHVTSHKDLIYHCHLCSGQFYSLDEFGEHQKHHSNAQIRRTTHTQSLPSNQQQQQTQALSRQNGNTSLRQQNQQVTPASNPTQQNSKQYNHQQIAPTQQQSSNQTSKNSRLFGSARPKNNQKYFRCSKCMNRYTTQRALDHHLSISTHNFPCTECNKVFMCERYLRRHLNTHTAVQHVCTFCDKHFKTAAYLKMHSVVHTGEKPFRCNQCEAAFNRRDKLNRHKLTHETVKKFKCPFRPNVGCTKEFNRPDKLKAHVLTHSGVRPHPCDSCSRTFSRLSRLREHKKLHHGTGNNSLDTKSRENSTNENQQAQQHQLSLPIKQEAAKMAGDSEVVPMDTNTNNLPSVSVFKSIDIETMNFHETKVEM